MLPLYGRQIVEALRECVLFLVRAALLLVRRSHGQDGRDRNAKARSGRMPVRPLMGVLLVSLLLALHAAPGGSAGGLALSGFGACAEPALASFASCGRFDPPPSVASMAAAQAGSVEFDAAMAEALVDPSIGMVGTALGDSPGSAARLPAVARPADDAASASASASAVAVADVDDRESIASPARSPEHGSLARDRDLSASAVARASARGAPGAMGVSGELGMSGALGALGASGASGMSGMSGMSGASGASGADANVTASVRAEPPANAMPGAGAGDCARGHACRIVRVSLQ
ncbi:MAG: hypothetical protein QM766_27285 [Burkholderiaceae bacterium]